VVVVVATATCEMVQILQDYGGVVCCFGSSASVENNAIFLQADCRSGYSCSSCCTTCTCFVVVLVVLVVVSCNE